MSKMKDELKHMEKQLKETGDEELRPLLHKMLGLMKDMADELDKHKKALKSLDDFEEQLDDVDDRLTDLETAYEAFTDAMEQAMGEMDDEDWMEGDEDEDDEDEDDEDSVPSGDIGFICSNCGARVQLNFDDPGLLHGELICPECGKSMFGEEDDDEDDDEDEED